MTAAAFALVAVQDIGSHLLEGGQELASGDGGGAHLPHHHAGGEVGQQGRFQVRGPRRQGESQGGQHRVAGPGDVEHLPGGGGDVDHPPGGEEAHPLLAAGDQERRGGKKVQQLEPCRAQALLVADFQTGGQLGLPLVGGHQGEAAIDAEVARLGVHQDPHLSGGGHFPQILQERLGDDPLAVVRDDHRAAVLQPSGEGRAQRRQVPRGKMFPRLPIEAHHLLVVGDDPRLDRGGAVGGTHHPRGADAAGGHLAHQPVARLVPADRSDDLHLPAQAADVVGNVGRPAEAAALLPHLHHRHRRFRGDALHLSPHIVVHDEIPDHRHPGPGESADKGPQAPGVHFMRSHYYLRGEPAPRPVRPA